MRNWIIVVIAFLAVFGASYAFMQWSNAPTAVETANPPPPPAPTTQALEAPKTTGDLDEIEPAAGPAGSEPTPPPAGDIPAGVPGAPVSTPSDVEPPAVIGPPMHDPLPPAAAGDPPAYTGTKDGHTGAKVISFFVSSLTKIDTTRAFGFVLLPKAAVSAQEKATQKSFCELILSSMDFMTPGAVAASAPAKVLATYWPIQSTRTSFEIIDAFNARDCTKLLAWYDHSLARKLAAKAGIAGLSGPLLITWPSGDATSTGRDPLIVDFSKATPERAAKTLQYWFRQLRNRPDLWTNKIREGTIRAELADAVNDTAGVVLAVLAGKWESLSAVQTP